VEPKEAMTAPSEMTERKIPQFGARAVGLSINEGGRYFTLAALTWREPAQHGSDRVFLFRIWTFGKERICLKFRPAALAAANQSEPGKGGIS